MAAPWYSGNLEEAIEESEEITSFLRGFDPLSPQSLTGSSSTNLHQVPPVFLPWSSFQPQSDVLSFTNRERSMELLGNSEEATEESEEVTNDLGGLNHPWPQSLIGSWSTTPPHSLSWWDFDHLLPQSLIGSWSTTPAQSPCFPSSPQYLNGSQLTTPSQSPPVFLPCFGFRPWSDALSFANRERSMLLQQELLDEWSDVFNCATAGGISQQQQQLHQLQYWIQVLNFVLKAATIMVNWWEQGSRGPCGEWVAKTRVGPKWLKKPKKSKRPCICGTYETAEVATMHGEEKYRMREEKTRLNFPKLFLKITDPCLFAGESDSTQELLQEWSNNAFDFNTRGIYELLQYWSYALNFSVKGLAMTLNGLRPIRKRQGHGGEWVVKIRIRRSRHGNGDLDIIKLKEEKTRLNFPKLFLSTCEKGKAITKTPGVKIEIPLKHILQCKEMRLRDAAKTLKVSPSTLIRICREYGIHSWPRCENNPINKSRPSKSPVVVDRERILQLNSDTMFSSKQDSATVDMNIVTVKARFGKGITIKFQLSLPWKMVELEQQVKRRLKLEPGTYHIKYKDDENELILIACDDDLKDCISRYGLMGTSSILVFLEPK